MPADVAVLFALYTVAAHCPRRRTLTAYAAPAARPKCTSSATATK
ncbi:hypothetical protein [Peterkaempfera sp. SMS 1(5)a]